MPLTNPKQAITHLYPGIKENQYSFRDDGAGVFLERLDPSFGTPPTHAELEAAEAAWVAPSILEGGNREPTSAELDAQPEKAVLYYKMKIQAMLDAEAGRRQFGEVVVDGDGRELKFVGKMNSVAKYPGKSNFGQEANALLTWVDQVWKSAIDIQTAAAVDRTPAPTWEELRDLLPRPPI